MIKSVLWSVETDETGREKVVNHELTASIIGHMFEDNNLMRRVANTMESAPDDLYANLAVQSTVHAYLVGNLNPITGNRAFLDQVMLLTAKQIDWPAIMETARKYLAKQREGEGNLDDHPF